LLHFRRPVSIAESTSTAIIPMVAPKLLWNRL